VRTVRWASVANINVVEEADSIPSVADFKKDLDSKGSIKLSFRFITNRRPTTRQHRGTPVDDLKAMAVIPEKVLKGDARSHQTTYFYCRQMHVHD
jgi:hypothetical protein